MTPSPAIRPRFVGDAGFRAELERRVQEHFQRGGRSALGDGRMYWKTAILLAWFAASYALLVFAVASPWQAVLLAVSLALAIAGIGFCIQHDANHGAYSKSELVNRLLGLTLDLMGASSYVWRWKHNVFHHTYTNIDEADDDLSLGALGRLAPSQRRRSLHRFQHLYLWPLYGFLGPKWHLLDDFKNVARSRIGRQRFPRPGALRLAELVGAKAVYFGWSLVVPMLFHSPWVVLLFYGLTWFIVGVVLSVVFQLAHCVEEADFPRPISGSERMQGAWAPHQVQTTVDFARGSGLLTWYLGGLNFQIEHHLFPRICHVHYPALSPIVQKACAEFGIRYAAHEHLGSAVSSHWRWLKRMGSGCATS